MSKVKVDAHTPAQFFYSLASLTHEQRIEKGMIAWNENFAMFPSEWHSYMPHDLEVTRLDRDTMTYFEHVSRGGATGGVHAIGILSTARRGVRLFRGLTEFVFLDLAKKAFKVMPCEEDMHWWLFARQDNGWVRMKRIGSYAELSYFWTLRLSEEDAKKHE